MTTPLLFITLVTVVLLILLYWILSTLDFQEKSKKKGHRPSYHFETAQELFKYVEPDYEPEENSIQLEKSSFDYASVSWHLTREKWEESIKGNIGSQNSRNIILRLFEIDKKTKTRDIKVRSLQGKYEFKIEKNKTWYVSLGFINNDSFTSILTSNIISTNPYLTGEDA